MQPVSQSQASWSQAVQEPWEDWRLQGLEPVRELVPELLEPAELLQGLPQEGPRLRLRVAQLRLSGDPHTEPSHALPEVQPVLNSAQECEPWGVIGRVIQAHIRWYPHRHDCQPHHELQP